MTAIIGNVVVDGKNYGVKVVKEAKNPHNLAASCSCLERLKEGGREREKNTGFLPVDPPPGSEPGSAGYVCLGCRTFFCPAGWVERLFVPLNTTIIGNVVIDGKKYGISVVAETKEPYYLAAVCRCFKGIDQRDRHGENTGFLPVDPPPGSEPGSAGYVCLGCRTFFCPIGMTGQLFAPLNAQETPPSPHPSPEVIEEMKRRMREDGISERSFAEMNNLIHRRRRRHRHEEG